jgi:hypothetical protein
MWRNNHFLGTPSPYNWYFVGPLIPALGIRLTNPLQLPYFGCAPPPYFGSRIIVPWDIPSLCGSRTLPLCSPSGSVWPLTGLSSYCVCVSNQVDVVVLIHLNHPAFLLGKSVTCLVYIVAVVEWSEKWIFPFFFKFFWIFPGFEPGTYSCWTIP